MSCCPPSAWGPLASTDDTYQPKGIEETIGDCKVPVYYSKPTKPSKKAIVVFYDIYGYSNRLKFICDTFAANDYHVIMPDCFRGETIETIPDLPTLVKRSPIDVVMKDANACTEFLKSKSDAESGEDSSKLLIGSIGFCFGGWAIARSTAEGFSWDCAVSPHPATKLEAFVFGNDEAAMFEKVKIPFLLLPAGDDLDNIKPGSDIVKELAKSGGESVLFERMAHGWVTRGDLKQSDVKEDADKALSLSLDFFNKHM